MRRAISRRVQPGLPLYSRAVSFGRRMAGRTESGSTVALTTRVTKMPGRPTFSGSISPTSTISSTSAMTTLAALAKAGVKLRLLPRRSRLPSRSPR